MLTLPVESSDTTNFAYGELWSSIKLFQSTFYCEWGYTSRGLLPKCHFSPLLWVQFYLWPHKLFVKISRKQFLDRCCLWIGWGSGLDAQCTMHNVLENSNDTCLHSSLMSGILLFQILCVAIVMLHDSFHFLFIIVWGRSVFSIVMNKIILAIGPAICHKPRLSLRYITIEVHVDSKITTHAIV